MALKRVFRPRSGFIRNIPDDLSRETGISCAYNFKKIDSILVDISGNSLNGTITGTTNGLKGLVFNGTSDKVVCGDLGSVKSISFRIKPLTTTEQILEGAANDMLVHIAAGTLTSTDFGTKYINGSTGTTMVAGFWHSVTLTADTGVAMSAVTIALNNASYGAFEMEDIRFYSTELTRLEAIEYHNNFARIPYIREDFEDYTLDTTTTSLVGFSTTDGTYQVNELITDDVVLQTMKMGANHLTSITDGTISKYSEQTYGTWEWNIYKGGDGNVTNVCFISDSTNFTTCNGYYMQFAADESLTLYEKTGAVSTPLMTTVVSYLTIDTWYRIKVIRNIFGIFEISIKGGILTSDFGYDGWTIVVADSGDNPVTDDTHNACNYFLLNLDSGDQIANILLTEGGIMQGFASAILQLDPAILAMWELTISGEDASISVGSDQLTLQFYIDTFFILTEEFFNIDVEDADSNSLYSAQSIQTMQLHTTTIETITLSRVVAKGDVLTVTISYGGP